MCFVRVGSGLSRLVDPPSLGDSFKLILFKSLLLANTIALVRNLSLTLNLFFAFRVFASYLPSPSVADYNFNLNSME